MTIIESLYFCFIHRSLSYCLSSIAILKISMCYPLSLGRIWQQLSVVSVHIGARDSPHSHHYLVVLWEVPQLLSVTKPTHTSVCDSNTKWDRKLFFFFCCCRVFIPFVSPTSGQKMCESFLVPNIAQTKTESVSSFFFSSVACFYLSNMRNVKLRLPLLVWKLFKVLRGEVALSFSYFPALFFSLSVFSTCSQTVVRL